MKALVFDIDGVLLDHEYDKGHNWLDEIENDLMVSRDLIEKIHKDSQQWKQLSLGNDNIEKYFNSFVVENNITRVSAMQLINYFINRDTKSRNYMLEEVKKLKNKNYKLYIGTHQVPEKGQRLWFIESFSDYFLDMFTSYNIGYMKSEVEFFNEVSERIGIEKSETILIDDKQKNVDTAMSAGWQGYLYESFDKIKSELFERL